MITRIITVIAVLLCGGATASPAATAAPTHVSTNAAAKAQPASGTTGWRFRQGNICVQDQTGGRLIGGLWESTVAWSKAEDINLIYAKSCANYKQAQMITVQTYTRFYGACHVAKVWTTGGYLKPGLVTRAALFINTECNTKTLALGLPIGLSEQSPYDESTVMGFAGLPTPRDYRVVEQIYPW